MIWMYLNFDKGILISDYIQIRNRIIIVYYIIHYNKS